VIASRTNDELHDALNLCKDQIPSTAWRWDACKRVRNEYELVRNVAGYQPVSRAFFKLWEILHDFRREMDVDRSAPMTAAFLAEGPGGFVESFATFRNAQNQPDRLHCITLVSQKHTVPGWKLASVRRAAAPGSTVKVSRGADGTGDLYRLANLRHFVASGQLAGACHLVTADGGFDYSGDFNAQERASTRLLLCEVYAALLLQAPGGAFVLKVFDVRCAETIALLYALRRCYAEVRVVKPLTSRPANSEKYVVCTGFLGPPPAEIVEAMRAAIAGAEANPDRPLALASGMSGMHAPDWFLEAVVEMNSTFVARQVGYIASTLALARSREARHPAELRRQSQDLERLQFARSTQWCRSYGI
jgi:23S rRNA U2552 (ribose-2'-O)-methylase RlmE/FtsJ